MKKPDNKVAVGSGLTAELNPRFFKECPCGCKLPLKADGTVDYVLDFKEVVCQCKPGCGTRFHVPAHQARIGAGNIWFAAGHVSTTSPVAVVVECKRE